MSGLVQLIQNPIFALSGYVIGLLALAAHFYFHHASRKISEVKITRSNVRRFGQAGGTFPAKNGDVPVKTIVTYGEESGPAYARLMIDEVTFVNSGTEIVYGTSIVDDDPLLIKSNTGKFIDANIVGQTNKLCGSGLERCDKGLVVRFKFLNPRDVITVQAIHTGEDDLVGVSGTVIGTKVRDVTDDAGAVGRVVVLSFLALVLDGLAAGTLSIFDRAELDKLSKLFGALTVVLFTILYFSSALSLVRSGRLRALFSRNRRHR